MTIARNSRKENGCLGSQVNKDGRSGLFWFRKYRNLLSFPVGEAGKVDEIRFLHIEPIDALEVESPAKRTFPTLVRYVEVTQIQKRLLGPISRSGDPCLKAPWSA